MSRVLSILLALVLSAVPSGGASAEEPALSEAVPVLVSDPELASQLEPIRERWNVPGLAAGIVRGNRLDVVAAVGVRKAGSDVELTVGDKLHIGSCTKAMTATLLAKLIEQSQLRFESTIGEVFANLKQELHPDFHAVTLEQLLTHRAGLPANAAWRDLGSGTVVDQRDVMLKRILSQPPAHSPGTKFLYSNVGYVVAGHMAEQITGRPWEELMRETLFTPLEMASAGFGPPGTKGEIDEPWGHQLLLGKHVPLQDDNAASLGPAGTVHATLADWGKFAALHLEGARGGSRFLTADTFRRLHTAPEGEPRYACGWIVGEREWAGGKVVTHAGSNTMWLATVWIAPERNCALLAVANQGGDAGTKACDEAIGALIQRVKERGDQGAAAPGDQK